MAPSTQALAPIQDKRKMPSPTFPPSPIVESAIIDRMPDEITQDPTQPIATGRSTPLNQGGGPRAVPAHRVPTRVLNPATLRARLAKQAIESPGSRETGSRPTPARKNPINEARSKAYPLILAPRITRSCAKKKGVPKTGASRLRSIERITRTVASAVISQKPLRG